MILLQSKDIFDDILVLDPETEKFTSYKRSKNPEFKFLPISGTFSNLADNCLMLYRLGSDLIFSMDNQKILIDNNTVSFLEKKGNRAVLIFKKNDKEELRFEYNLSDLEQPIPGDTTPYVSEEDFDFCQFVHNVLSNSERRDFIYKNP